jgi:hypothetical protein
VKENILDYKKRNVNFLLVKCKGFIRISLEASIKPFISITALVNTIFKDFTTWISFAQGKQYYNGKIYRSNCYNDN